MIFNDIIHVYNVISKTPKKKKKRISTNLKSLFLKKKKIFLGYNAIEIRKDSQHNDIENSERNVL